MKTYLRLAAGLDFKDAADLESDPQRKVRLLSDAGAALKNGAKGTRDEYTRVKQLSDAGDAFRKAADFEIDPRRKMNLLSDAIDSFEYAICLARYHEWGYRKRYVLDAAIDAENLKRDLRRKYGLLYGASCFFQGCCKTRKRPTKKDPSTI